MSVAQATRVALWLSVAGVPLVFWRAPYDPFDVPKLALLLVAAGIGVGGVVLARLVPTRTVWVPVAAVCAPVLLSWLVNGHKAWGVLGEYSRYQGVLSATAFGVWTLALAAVFRTRERLLVGAIAVGGVGVALYGLVQLFGLDPFDWSYSDYIASTVGHSNFAGAVLAISLPAVMALWIERGRWSPAARVATVLIVVALIGTFSQGAWIAAVAGCCVMAGLLARRSVPRLFPVLVAVAGLAALATVAVVVVSQFEIARALHGTSIWTRGLSWSTAFAVGADNPLFGWGPDAFAYLSSQYRSPVEALVVGRADDPHSVPLATFANQGIVGVAGLLLVVVWAARRIREGSDDSALAAFAGGVVAYATVAVVTVNELPVRSMFWTCIAGLALVTTPDRASRERTRGGLTRALSLGLVALLAIGSVFFAVRLLAADVGLNSALAELRASNLGRATASFGDMDLERHLFHYQVYGDALARVAVDAEPDAEPYWTAMSEQHGRIAAFPYVRYAGSAADGLAQRSAFDSEFLDEALTQWRLAHDLDPHDPRIAVEIASLLIRGEEPREALSVLVPLERRLAGPLPAGTQRVPELLGMVAIAHAAVGDTSAAAEALRIADAAGARSCRVLLARRFLERQGIEVDGISPLTTGALALQTRLACPPSALALLGPLTDPPGLDRSEP